METYVWELCRELLERKLSIRVICEEYIEPLPDLDSKYVFQVEKASPRPRWKALRSFQNQVLLLVQNSEEDFGLIHSHERSLIHDVTTIHGPLVGSLNSMSVFQRLNRRMRQWSNMEAREVSGHHVRAACGVSSKIIGQVAGFYPQAPLVKEPMWPGVYELKGSLARPKNGATTRVVFIGREWKRKGLDLAANIVAEARSLTGSDLHLTVIGPDLAKIPTWIRKKSYITCLGPCPPDYHAYDILIHPARNEPFGMVVAEARAHGLSCLLSDRVGAVDLEFEHSSVVKLNAPYRLWAEELVRLCQIQIRNPEVKWRWGDLADRSISLYKALGHV